MRHMLPHSVQLARLPCCDKHWRCPTLCSHCSPGPKVHNSTTYDAAKPSAALHVRPVLAAVGCAPIPVSTLGDGQQWLPHNMSIWKVVLLPARHAEELQGYF